MTAKQGSEQAPTILVADDDPELRKMLRVHLESINYQVIEAHDGEKALEAIILSRPALVVLDVMMPELNGWEICKYVKSRKAYDSIKIVMLTGIGATVNELTSPLYGADAYLDKPFDIDQLEATLRTLLGPQAGG
jgi:DNA-binding response OmpR family regulator